MTQIFSSKQLWLLNQPLLKRNYRCDMDRHIYQDFNLTLAQHPSETEQRLMIRLLAFALNAREGLGVYKRFMRR